MKPTCILAYDNFHLTYYFDKVEDALFEGRKSGWKFTIWDLDYANIIYQN